MQILDPNEIKEDKKETIEQGKKLVHMIAEEEAKINKELNLLRDHAKIQKEQIKKETDEFITENKILRDNLEKEVVSLEARKIQALKPIIDTQKDVDEALKGVKQALVAIETRNRELDTFHEEQLELAEDLRDRKADLDTREIKISSKENVIKAEEGRLKDGMSRLTEKWVEFHLTVAKANTNFEKRENKIKDDSKILDIRSENQDKRDIEQNNRDLLIRDKYSTLERIVDRLKKLYNTDINI